MKNWLANRLGLRHTAAGPDQIPPPEQKSETEMPAGGLPRQQEDLAALRIEQEVQSLRFELREREETIEKLRQEIDRLRSRQDEFLAERLESQLSGLFSDLSTPASQVLTQAYLLEEKQKPVQARDVLFVVRRIIRTLEQYGMVFEGKVGDQVAFDPNRHIPIGASIHPQSGQSVTVRFPGTYYAGKIITKAGVE